MCQKVQPEGIYIRLATGHKGILPLDCGPCFIKLKKLLAKYALVTVNMKHKKDTTTRRKRSGNSFPERYHFRVLQFCEKR